MQFRDVVSQSHVTTTLENAIKQERVASAYLFSGPRGVGKTTTARIFAKAMNCDSGPTPTPCNTCSSCKEITDSRSLDVFEIDGASNRGIDEVRNLRENLKYAPSKGKHKIYIIDEVHMLTTEAFNALLKTLEEPPSRVLFIFATTEPHKVPATILSRCQRYDFRRIPLQEIVAQLQNICSEEKIKIEDEALYLIARKAEGSMRDSLSILDQVVSFSGQKVKLEELSELLGILDQDLFFQYTTALAQRDVHAGLQLIETIFKRGYDITEFLSSLVEHFRNILVLQATDNLSLIEGGEAYAAKYKQITNSFSETDLLRLIKLTSEAAYQVKRSSSPKMILEILFMKMVRMDKSVDLEELLQHIGKLDIPASSPAVAVFKTRTNDTKPLTQPKLSQAGPIPDARSQSDKPTVSQDRSEANTEPPREEVAPTLDAVKQSWEAIVDAVKSHKIHLGSFLNEGYPTGLRGDTLEVSFGKENGFHINAINRNKKLIQNAILDQTGFRVRIECKKNESEEFQDIVQKHKPVSSPAPEPSVAEDLQVPILKKVLEVFDGEIVRTTR